MFQINPVAFTIFGLSVNWYGIVIAAGALIAILLCSREAKRVGLKEDDIIDLALILIPLGIVCARIYYVVFELDTYLAYGSFWEVVGAMVDIRSGGLAIYGAVIGGFIGLFIYKKWKKISVWRLTDIIAPSLILAQGIGRWGNFFNQEAYGYVVNNVSQQWFPLAVYINATGEWHYATFFYESVWCILSAVVLYIYQHKNPKTGNVFAAYLCLYGFERMIVEGMRTDSLYWGPVRVSQVLSGILFIAAGAYLLNQFLQRGKRVKVAHAPAIEDVDPELKIIPDEVKVQEQEEYIVEKVEDYQEAPVEDEEATDAPQKMDSSDEDKTDKEKKE